MNDPRTSHFYKLRKRDPSQLTTDEARQVQRVCERMIDYVRDGKARRQWKAMAAEYSKLADAGDGGTSR